MRRIDARKEAKPVRIALGQMSSMNYLTVKPFGSGKEDSCLQSVHSADP